MSGRTDDPAATVARADAAMDDAPSSARPAGFERALGPWSAYTLVAGSMIGTGIFFFVSPVAEHVGSATGILAVWLVGTAVATCGALCVAELAAAYPATGGIYVFLREAFGPLAAFLYAWANILILRIGSIAITVVAFAAFFGDLLGLSAQPGTALNQTFAITALAAITYANASGVRTGARVQVTLTLLKLLALVCIVAVAAAYAAGLLTGHAIDLEPADRTAPSTWGFAVALVPVMWTLGGWDESPYVAEEVRNPERNLPLSVLAGLWSVGGLYVLVNGAYLLVLSPTELAASGSATATLVVERALGPGAAGVLSLVLVISTLGAANGLTLTSARLSYAAGRDHRSLGWLGRLDVARHTPTRGLLLQGTLCALAILVLRDPFVLLLYTAVAYWLFAASIALALVVLRRREPGRRRPFRVRGYPLVPLAFVLAAVCMAASAAEEDPRSALATAVILAAGALVYRIEGRVAAHAARRG